MHSTQPATQEQIESRLDLKLMQSFANTTNAYGLRNYLIAHGTTDKAWRTLLPDIALTHAIDLPEHVAAQLNQQALQSQLDYQFERLTLPQMSLRQAHTYLLATRQNLQVQPLALGQTVLLESLHHTLTFSALFSATVHLLEHYDYNHVIMMHQHQSPDPRVLVLKALLEQYYNSATTLKHFDNLWFRTVKKLCTPQTIIVSMGDLPTFGRPSDKTLALSYPTGVHRQTTFSIADQIAGRLPCNHLICDYPDNAIVLRHSDQNPLNCPLTDWMFWPALNDMFLS